MTCSRLTTRPLSAIFLVSTFWGFVILGSVSAQATNPLNVNLANDLPTDKWYIEGRAPKRWGTNPKMALLQKIQFAESNKKWSECYRLAERARTKNKIDSGWLWVKELRCLHNEVRVAPKRKSQLYLAISGAEKKLRQVTQEHFFESLNQEIYLARMLLVDQEKDKRRATAWRLVDQMLAAKGSLSSDEKADLFRMAGDLAIVDKNSAQAISYYDRSLNERDDPGLRKIYLDLVASAEGVPTAASKVLGEGTLGEGPEDGGLKVSLQGYGKEEEELVRQIQEKMKSGDNKGAIKSASAYLQKFPGSSKAKWTSDRLLDIFLGAIRQHPVDKGFVKSWLVEVKNVDAEFLLSWIKSLHFSGFYTEALELCSSGREQWVQKPKFVELTYWCGRSARNLDDLDTAKSYFEQTFHSGYQTQVAREANLYLALIFYRQQNWSAAIRQIKDFLAQDVRDDEWDCSARYWLWRALQKGGFAEQARVAAADLQGRHPLSYYGLRARWESGQLNKSWLGLTGDSSQVPKKSLRIWLSPAEKAQWQQVVFFMRAGWLEAAVAEWKNLGPLGGREGRLFSLAVDSSLLLYPEAMSKAVEFIRQDDLEWRGYLFSVLFPQEFDGPINEFSRRYKVNKTLVRSLIKQESAYNVRAKSGAQAMGLMQLIPPTAKEIAENLRIKDFSFPEDLYDESTNVQFGTYYLARMLRFTSGHVPLALAAYNAGPGRVGRWLNARPALSGLKQVRSSNSDEEVWIDEVPWPETRNYIKLILRNLIMYRAIYDKNVVIGDLIWDTDSPATASADR